MSESSSKLSRHVTGQILMVEGGMEAYRTLEMVNSFFDFKEKASIMPHNEAVATGCRSESQSRTQLEQLSNC